VLHVNWQRKLHSAAKTRHPGDLPAHSASRDTLTKHLKYVAASHGNNPIQAAPPNSLPAQPVAGAALALVPLLMAPLIERIPFLSNRPIAIEPLESQFQYWSVFFLAA
jgi:hypothetical protein